MLVLEWVVVLVISIVSAKAAFELLPGYLAIEKEKIDRELENQRAISAEKESERMHQQMLAPIQHRHSIQLAKQEAELAGIAHRAAIARQESHLKAISGGTNSSNKNGVPTSSVEEQGLLAMEHYKASVSALAPDLWPLILRDYLVFLPTTNSGELYIGTKEENDVALKAILRAVKSRFPNSTPNLYVTRYPIEDLIEAEPAQQARENTTVIPPEVPSAVGMKTVSSSKGR